MDKNIQTSIKFAPYSALVTELNEFWKKYNSGDTDGDKPISLYVKRIIFNDPATIVFWTDGSKTVVKCEKGQPFNKYYGFCAAVAKRVFGNNSRVSKLVDNGFDAKGKK